MSLPAVVGTCNTAPTWNWTGAEQRHAGSRAKRPPRRLLTEPATRTVVMELAEGVWDIEVQEPAPQWFDETVKALEQLSTLQDNWDSFGARPVKDDTILAALDLAYQILSDGADTPAVVPTSDSGVQLEWHGDGYDLEMRVRPSGEISAFRFDEAVGEGDTVDGISLNDLQPLVTFLDQG